MKPTSCVCLMIAVAALLPSCFAGTAYVVTDNDNSKGNSATIYSLNTSTGELTHLLDLPTGGFGGGGYFQTVGIGAAMNGTTGCLFVYDTGSSDIASFEVNHATFAFNKVGNFANAALTAEVPGGILAVTPNGKFAYATYASTMNIGAWAVNSDCSLTFIAAYEASAGADFYEGIKVTPNGRDLIVSAPDFGAVEQFSINQTTGELTDLGFASFSLTSFPGGIDITADSRVAIIGNYVIEPSVLAVEITPTGLKHPAYFPLSHTGTLTLADTVPFLSAAAYKGSGPLYLGFSGAGAGSQPGIVTARFSEARKSITGKTATPINSANQTDGLIASTGNLMIVSERPNTLQIFTINADGTLTATAQGPVVNDKADGAYSFSIYPDTR